MRTEGALLLSQEKSVQYLTESDRIWGTSAQTTLPPPFFSIKLFFHDKTFFGVFGVDESESAINFVKKGMLPRLCQLSQEFFFEFFCA